LDTPFEVETGKQAGGDGGTKGNGPRLLLVDGHAYAYRAFFAIRALRSPSDEPTNAIFGFVQMLTRLRAAVRASHALAVWDGGLAAERVAAWPAYKAQRPAMPDELRPQLDGMVAWLQAAGWSSFCADGVEADDYIATVTRHAGAAGWPVVIASSDKDFMQLVSATVGLFNPNDKTDRIWTAAEVRAKTGVPPEQVVDWLSLVGDSVDNIPGVPGVGPKTAAALLAEFGSVAGIYARLPQVKGERLRANLAAAEESVRRNQALVRLNPELPCAWDPAGLAIRSADAAQLRELYARWGFRSLLAALGPATPASQTIWW